MRVEQVLKVKNGSAVIYPRFLNRSYNTKSKDNLKQVAEKKKSENLKRLQGLKEIDNINNYYQELAIEYSANGLDMPFVMSKQMQKNINEKVNVFCSSLLSNYNNLKGFRQNTITFLTLTLSETQKHTDKVFIRALAKFLDDLKRTKNYLIDPITKKQLKECAIPLKNYIWRAETQENGNIHFHLLLDTFVNKDVVNRLWNNQLTNLGYKSSLACTRIESLKRIKDIGAYISKYMEKPPLKDIYNNDKRKLQGLPKLKKNVLENIKDIEKYRRPIFGKVWGCSRDVMKLKYIEFVENDIAHAVELTNKMKLVKSDKIPEGVSVYVGKVRSILKKCSYTLQSIFKWYYKKTFDYLYNINQDCKKSIPKTFDSYQFEKSKQDSYILEFPF